MDASIEHLNNLDEGILRAANCERGYACLGAQPACDAVRFTHRDVEVVKCLSNAPCAKRISCDGMQVCTCPVRQRVCGLA